MRGNKMDFAKLLKKMDLFKLDFFRTMIFMMDLNKKMDSFTKDSFKMEFQKVKVNYVEKIKFTMEFLLMDSFKINKLLQDKNICT